jgi:hypothetical protein
MQLGLPPWQDVAALVVAFALWRSLVYFNRKSPLDDLKGPPGGGLVEGQFNKFTHQAGMLLMTIDAITCILRF